MTYEQCLLAALLILINAAISLALGLGLGKRLLVASVRMTVQLLLIGLVLGWVFSVNQPAIVLVLLSLMTVVAGFSAVDRVKFRYPEIVLNSIISMWASSWLVTFIAVSVIIQVKPWYSAQYIIPLLGMIAGNTLNGISLGLDRLTSELHARRAHIETLLAHGATSWEAARMPVREAVRNGMTPTLNTMMITGIVSLPGMMTGQLLAGVKPEYAVRYQIVIMFLIAAGAALGTLLSALIAFRSIFNDKHQFMFSLLRTEKGAKSSSIM